VKMVDEDRGAAKEFNNCKRNRKKEGKKRSQRNGWKKRKKELQKEWGREKKKKKGGNWGAGEKGKGLADSRGKEGQPGSDDRKDSSARKKKWTKRGKGEGHQGEGKALIGGQSEKRIPLQKKNQE